MSSARSDIGQTWLEPEEYAYPAGSLRQSRRRARVLCSDGRIRVARVGIPDTYFSIPARLKVNGRTVSGYVGCELGEGYRFHAYTHGKNCDALPKWNREEEIR